ncbi:MAG: SCO6880 family protein, partial [Actinomycetes bacterium]
AYSATLDPAHAGVDPGQAWPVAADASWGSYRTDSALHATYWVAQWPRIDVGATFLAPLLMQTNVLRSVATVMEPVAPSVAIRKVEAARTTDIADEQTRARTGFMTTARKRLQQDATLRREEELADGHAEFRFAGYVTVSAPDPDALERSCAEVEHAAQQARLELVRLYGQQPEGFTFTLPLGRGLR